MRVLQVTLMEVEKDADTAIGVNAAATPVLHLGSFSDLIPLRSAFCARGLLVTQQFTNVYKQLISSVYLIISYIYIHIYMYVL